MPEHVLAEDHPHVDHRADGNRDARQGHHVGIHAEDLHSDEGHQDRERKKSGNESGTLEVPDHEDHHDDGDEDLQEQSFFERAEGLLNEAGPVVEGHDRNFGDRSVGKCFRRKTR